MLPFYGHRNEIPTEPVGVLSSRILLPLCQSRPFTDGNATGSQVSDDWSLREMITGEPFFPSAYPSLYTTKEVMS